MFVPKVHPATREVEADDPMELVAAPVAGDPEVMLDGLIQEFAMMGWDAEQLMALFRSPAYPLLHQLLAHYGEAAVRDRVEGLVGRSGLFQVREVFAEEPDDDEEPDVVPLSIDRLTRRG
jgi:hypothetical protein